MPSAYCERLMKLINNDGPMQQCKGIMTNQQQHEGSTTHK
jgi:hypothetical protein